MRRALISVYNKEGLVPFAQGMMEMGIEMMATLGTLKYLVEAGIPAVDLSNVVGMPSILSGRLKTLHPKIHGGLLADRNRVEHATQMRNLGLLPIDILVVNMNPFLQEVSFDDLIENIDTGGPALIRSAARNYKHVVVVTNPEQYPAVLKRLKTKSDDEQFRANLAAVAFSATARYDALIASSMAAKLYTKELFPPILPGHYIRETYLHHGENEHQKAAFYRNLMAHGNNISMMKQTTGTELGGSQILNSDIGWECISIFKKPSVAIIKHRSPVGIAVRDRVAEAFRKAYECDPRGAQGGLIAVNRPLDMETVALIGQEERFFEGIIAVGYKEGVVEALRGHPVWGNEIQILEMPPVTYSRSSQPTVKALAGGLLLEEADEVEGETLSWRIVTRVKPSEKQLVDMAFALAVAGITKSSAAVLAKGSATVGIGTGQTSSLEAVAVAISKAGTNSQGTVMALDSACQFPQAIRLAYEAGITAVIQPRDNSKSTSEAIGVANELGVPIVFCKNAHCRY